MFVFAVFLCYRKDSLSSAVPEGMEYIEPITESDDTLEIQQVTYPLLRFIILLSLWHL